MPKSILPLSSSRNFIILGIVFSSLTDFEFTFISGVKKCSNFKFNLLHVTFPAPLIEDTVFSPLYISAFFTVH